jgi:2-oxoglutarate ferredoxin oxidoreductase subunit alpha
LTEHIVEIISDSGEGAQRCGQSLGAIAARTGNGIWTTEIIPAEIQPPARSVAGASGIRIRIGTKQVTNGGDETDLVVAFNEQVLLGRVRAGELKSAASTRFRWSASAASWSPIRAGARTCSCSECFATSTAST